MKKTFTLFLFLIGVIGLRAQVIPNHNFENWSNGINSAPDGWDDRGSQTNGFYPAVQSTDQYAGTYSVRIENKISGVDTTKGIIETEQPGGDHGMKPSFPVSFTYTSLKGFYKYAPQQGDSAQIISGLFKNGYVNPLGYGELLGIGSVNLGAAATFTPFTTDPFYYFASQIPDSAYISISAYAEIDLHASNPGRLPVHGNSVLYIDALNYDTYLTTGIDNKADITTNFSLFPSAGNGDIHVNFETSVSDFTTIKVYDLTAREIKNLYSGQLNSGIQSFNYSLNDVPNGNYLFVVATDKGCRAQKFSIAK